MKLEPHRVGRETLTRQPRPLDHALTFFDPLLARPAFVVEGDDPLGGLMLVTMKVVLHGYMRPA
jgi:hypothetical protein